MSKITVTFIDDREPWILEDATCVEPTKPGFTNFTVRDGEVQIATTHILGIEIMNEGENV